MTDDWLLSTLGCPAGSCPLHPGPGQILCHRCGRHFGLDDGIVTDTRVAVLPNHLETIDYDAGHGVSLSASRALGERWMDLVRAELGDRPDLVGLELGAGTGLLTLGVTLRLGFKRLLVSDVSATFLRLARARVDAAWLPEQGCAADRLAFVLCSLDDLPIQPGTVDVVMANSVLHHIYDWQAALLHVRHVLKPGGVAIFGEPVLQGQAFVGFLARVMADIDEQSAEPAFTPAEQAALRDLVTLCTRDFWAGAAQIKRATADDKHLFDLDAVGEAARALGFASMRAHAPAPLRDGLLAALEGALTIMGVAPQALARYAPLCRAFQEQVVDQLPDAVTPPFMHLVFRR